VITLAGRNGSARFGEMPESETVARRRSELRKSRYQTLAILAGIGTAIGLLIRFRNE
jgi:hypothetical protein